MKLENYTYLPLKLNFSDNFHDNYLFIQFATQVFEDHESAIVDAKISPDGSG